MFRGKKYQESMKLIDKQRLYDSDEALSLATQTAKAKFDETIGLSVKLGVDPRHALLHLAAAVRHALALGNGKEQQNGHHDQHHQRQLPLHAKQHDERANQRDHGNEQVFRAVVRQLRNFKQIVRHARHQPARAVAVIKREG